MPHPSAIDPADWTTIWQSEMAALATDRECQERAAAMAVAMSVDLAHLAPLHDAGDSGRGDDGPAGRAGADAAAGAAAAGAAPGDGGPSDGEIERLRRRIAELEGRA